MRFFWNLTKGTETTTNLNQKLYYHVLGTKQSEDVLVAEFPDHPKWHSSAVVSNRAGQICYACRKDLIFFFFM